MRTGDRIRSGLMHIRSSSVRLEAFLKFCRDINGHFGYGLANNRVVTLYVTYSYIVLQVITPYKKLWSCSSSTNTNHILRQPRNMGRHHTGKQRCRNAVTFTRQLILSMQSILDGLVHVGIYFRSTYIR